MKNAKYIISGIITVFIGIVVYQNKAYFFSLHQLHVDLWVVDKIQSPYLYNGFYLLACFLLGLLAAYLFGRFEKYKLRKSIKAMNAAVTAKEDRIVFLEREGERLREQPDSTREPEVKIPDSEPEALLEGIEEGNDGEEDHNEKSETETDEEFRMKREDTIVDSATVPEQTKDRTLDKDE